MKINTPTRRLNKKGMTLIEISLVVALLLSLIAILFLGIAAYKKGADRAKCVIQLSSVQKAVRSHQNMFDGVAGGPLVHTTTLMGPGLYFENVLNCPDTATPGVYTYCSLSCCGRSICFLQLVWWYHLARSKRHGTCQLVKKWGS